MKLTFIGWESPSGNKFHKQHWRVYSNYKTKVCLPKILNAYRAAGEHHANRRMRVKFTLYRKRLVDDDNLRGGIKPIRDCLIVAGFIRDDSPKWGEFEYEQHTLKHSPFDRMPGIVIEITPISDPIE